MAPNALALSQQTLLASPRSIAAGSTSNAPGIPGADSLLEDYELAGPTWVQPFPLTAFSSPSASSSSLSNTASESLASVSPSIVSPGISSRAQSPANPQAPQTPPLAIQEGSQATPRATRIAELYAGWQAPPPSLASIANYLEHSRETMKQWRLALRSLLRSTSELKVVLVKATTVDEGAKALLEASLRLASGSGPADYITDAAEVIDFSDNTIACRYPDITIGEAIGPGPVRAVFGRITQILAEDAQHWMKTSDDEYYTPVIPGTPVSHEDLVYFKSAGIVIRMALFWGQDLLPISPMLLALLIGGLNAATDTEFLAVAAPELAGRLATWPPPRTTITSDNQEREVYDVQNGRDPMNMIMEFVPNTQVHHIRSLTATGVAELTPHLASALLFHTQDINHPIFEALKDGLNYRARGLQEHAQGEGSSRHETLLETFEGFSVPEVVAGLCLNRRITSYADLIPLLKPTVAIQEGDPAFSYGINYQVLAERWMAALKRYLSGTGHPDHDLFSQMQADSSNAAIESAAAAGENYRSTLFLQAISDSPFIPRGRMGDDADLEVPES
ncbi:hypothetical protein ACG7TL_006728 [Trametes sanguinea]